MGIVSFFKSKPSMHLLYKTEKEGMKVHEESYGFVTYKQEGAALCVVELYVLPKYRGKGLGAKLMEVAQEIADRSDLKLVTCIDPKDEHAPALRSIFKNLGLKPKQTINLQMEVFSGVS
jgi:GNAT superfamily N-acetyltransferase